MINKINIYGLTLIFAFACGIQADAQVEDSTLWRTHKVKQISSWVNFMQFENSEDTCLFEIKKLNEKGWLMYVKQDYNCHGWGSVSETTFLYDDKGRTTMISNTQNDNVVSHSRMWYDEHNRVTREENKYFEPYVLQLVTYEYFGKVDKPDSMISTQVNNGDSTLFKTSFTYKNGKKEREDVVDITNNKPVSRHVMKYDKNKRVVRDEYVLLQTYDEDEITIITYNENNQIKKTQSDINNTAAEFWYHGNGLLAKTFYYNRFETMERQVWHKYEYFD